MNSREVRERYLKYFEKHGHIRIDPAPLVLPNDPTTLFTSSGMQPLVPYLMGKEHSKGKRVIDSQPCIRTQDIEEVGDNRHTTFFEMLGNWSLGDYFKSEQLAWIFDFLTNKEEGLGLDPQKLYVSVYEGDSSVEKDFASIDIWKNIFESLSEPMEVKVADLANGIGLQEGARIFPYNAKKNWWSRSGTPDQMPMGEIGGPDSEVFYDFGLKRGFHENSVWKDEPCHPNCDCGRFMEIGNSVFIQYKKKEDGGLEELPQKNVDFGGGLERLVAAANDEPDVFKIDLFIKIIDVLNESTEENYDSAQINRERMRVIADHIRAAVFLMDSGIVPSNKGQGYVLRRLLRRLMVKMHSLKGYQDNMSQDIAYNLLVDAVLKAYEGIYFFSVDRDRIQSTVSNECDRFAKTFESGMKLIGKETPFNLFQSYGFPPELTEELLKQQGQEMDWDSFNNEFESHKEQSRTTSAGTFKGGLADSSTIVTRYHTATHLLLASLRRVLGEHVIQKGQNITAERSRFDFSYEAKLTDEQLHEVESMINEMVFQDLPVQTIELPKEEAEATGAIHAFNERYGENVTIYFVGDSLETAYSKEFCGGPHVKNTKEIGRVRIKKQEKIGDGVIRIYLVFEEGQSS